jgi:hypothetical protein
MTHPMVLPGLCGSLMFMLSGALFTAPSVPASDSKDVLDSESEKVVRDAVYSGEMCEYTIFEPPFDRVLYIPKPVVQVYEKHPKGVLELLVKIIEGGRPRDSVLAAAYAVSLQAGPAVGTVCADHFDENTYDILDNDWGTTPRKHWIAKIREARKKSQRDK